MAGKIPGRRHSIRRVLFWVSAVAVMAAAVGACSTESSVAKEILGVWKSGPVHDPDLDMVHEYDCEFQNDGKVVFRYFLDGRCIQHLKLNYRVKGDRITIVIPGHPESSARYRITGDVATVIDDGDGETLTMRRTDSMRECERPLQDGTAL